MIWFFQVKNMKKTNKQWIHLQTDKIQEIIWIWAQIGIIGTETKNLKEEIKCFQSISICFVEMKQTYWGISEHIKWPPVLPAQPLKLKNNKEEKGLSKDYKFLSIVIFRQTF